MYCLITNIPAIDAQPIIILQFCEKISAKSDQQCLHILIDNACIYLSTVPA
jgi:hypothetical protein